MWLGPRGDGEAMGYDVRFEATATTDLRREYSAVVTVFVAPHDPLVERRS